jgi:large subunit ribosomal protein L25
MADVLNVQQREETGKRRNRRLRHGGMVPAVLYGHGEANVSLAVPADQLRAALRHANRLVELQGAANESVLIKALQWDTFGTQVLHVDFARVSADERIEVALHVELRGEAPGIKQGGVVEQLARDVRIECRAAQIPDKVQLSVNALNVGDSLRASDLELPDDVKLLSDASEVIVHCIVPTEIEEEEAAPAPAEPELIGRKPAESEEEEE